MCHIKGKITSNRTAIIAGIAILATLPVAASAIGASGELRVEAAANPDFLDPALACVTADDTARTVVISLTRRDPALAEALALPFASVVPRGTKPVDQTVDPPAGIGAYVVAGFNPDASVTLQANPSFSVRDGLPAGKAARITITLGRTARAAAARVAAGDSDYSVSPVPVSAT
ncbi:MAG: hypothetical protein EBU54_17250, partial [Mycobacteriaceae bacterium]|nr:hypothetical protein [Mycobacteriaceae bacterium]